MSKQGQPQDHGGSTSSEPPAEIMPPLRRAARTFDEMGIDPAKLPASTPLPSPSRLLYLKRFTSIGRRGRSLKRDLDKAASAAQEKHPGVPGATEPEDNDPREPRPTEMEPESLDSAVESFYFVVSPPSPDLPRARMKEPAVSDDEKSTLRRTAQTFAGLLQVPETQRGRQRVRTEEVPKRTRRAGSSRAATWQGPDMAIFGGIRPLDDGNLVSDADIPPLELPPSAFDAQ